MTGVQTCALPIYHRKKKEHRNNCDEIAILFLLIHGFEKIISLLIRLFHKIIFLHRICRWLLDCKFPPDVEHKKGNGLYWAYQENVVLCGASAYEQKYYFNQDFDSLPESVKQELHIMCVLYTEEIGGILTLEFDDNGSLQFKTEALDADAMYDEIGSVLRIKKLQTEKRELLESLEMYYRVFFLGETIEDDGENVDKGN